MKIYPVTWSDIKTQILKVNPNLYEILDELVVQQDVLYSAEYHFGETIIENGVFQGISDIDELNYDLVPLGIIYDKELEVYIYRNNENVTINYFSPGSMLGVFPYINNFVGLEKRQGQLAKYRHVSSGARNLISAQQLLNKRKQKAVFSYLDCPSSVINERGYLEYKLFTDICIKEQVNWQSKILLIPRSIYDKLGTTGYQPLSKEIIKSGIGSYQNYSQQQFNVFYLWPEVLEMLRLRGYKCDLYTSQILYQIFSICLNSFGCRVIKGDSACPLPYIENVFNNIYKTSVPFKLLRVERSDYNTNEPIYVSLQNLVISIGNNNVPKMSPTLYKALEQIAHMVSSVFPTFDLVSKYVDKIKFISAYAEDGNMMIDNFSNAYDFLEKENLNKYNFFKNCIEIDLS